ncbi:MAG: HEAT repeat domain-containing protein [Planctomycetota bacterium]|nr:HEAT repeat domain-containing protein [Planctomycetota bacterium]
MRPSTALPFVLFGLLAICLPAATADVLTTSDGLVIEGKVTKTENGWYRIETADGIVELAPEGVVSVKEGEGPRTRLIADQARLSKGDARGWFAYALRAEAAGQPDLARTAYERVVAIEPGHKAARRALGHEQHGGAWLPSAEVRRKQGLVRYRGRWMLPAEVEKASTAPARPTLTKAADVARAHKLVAMLAGEDKVVAQAARVALAKSDEGLKLAGAKRALVDANPKVRAEAARFLGELGDEEALRALIFSGARDVDPDVRRAAVLAAASFGHDDTAVPFVRALGSENLRLVANAAQALATLGDERAAGYIVKRLVSHGSSSRNFVAFVNQVSYVRDYDVEIAQLSNIANPDVATLLEGVILDVKVLDASFTKTWIEPILVDSLSELAGRPLRNKAEAMDWFVENKQRLPDFPKKPNQRAPRRSKGKVIGVPANG